MAPLGSAVPLKARFAFTLADYLKVCQWLFRRNGFQVSDTGSFAYCNGDTTIKSFQARFVQP
jgi:hypothetical protein